MKRKFMKALSVLFSMCLILSALPATAFAAGPPVLQSATVTADGSGIELIFDKAMAAPESGSAGFAVMFSVTGKQVTAAQLDGTDSTKIRLALTTTVKGGEDVWLRYTPGTVASADGGMLAEISYKGITNALPRPVLNASPPPGGMRNVPYSHTFAISGGQAPYIFSSTGELPTGLTLNNSTGVLSGTPTATGIFNFIGIIVVDSNSAIDSRSFSISIDEPVNVCQIGSTGYSTLDGALNAVLAGGATATVIKLLQDINYTGGMTVSNKKITFDLNGKTLTADNNNATMGAGLYVTGGSVIDIINPGAFNVTGGYTGLDASNSTVKVSSVNAGGSYGIKAINSNITVTNDVTSTSYMAVAASGGSKIGIGGNVSGDDFGVYAQDAGTAITVTGNVSAVGANSCGAHSRDGAAVTVRGNITAAGSSNSIGAKLNNGGTLTVDGTITSQKYIMLGVVEKTAADKTTSTTKPDYYTYTDGTSTVWVKDTSSKAAEIGGTKYATLDDALSVIGSGQTKTITLLQDITYNKGISINGGQNITFNLDGHTLIVSNSSGIGLLVTNGHVGYAGTGAFNVTGRDCGVSANGAGASATVTTAAATSDGGNGAVAMNGGYIAVNGDVQGGYNGVSVANTGSTAVINGNATATGTDSGSSGARAGSGGSVIINGGTAQGLMYGAYANGDNALVTINNGNAVGAGTYSHGVHAEGGGSIQVGGNVEGGQYGADVSGTFSSAIITGNVKVIAELNGWGINVERDGKVEVKGNVVASGQSQGVFASSGGTAMIDGEIQAQPSRYIRIYNTITQAPVDFDGSPGSRINPTTKDGYYTYSAGPSTVWVKETSPAVSASLSPDTGTFDKNLVNQADVSTTITWNDAASVTDVRRSGISVGAAAYAVSGNILTIKKEYLALQPAGSLVLTVAFDKGNTAELTIVISDSTPPVGNNLDLTWHDASGSNGAIAGNVSHIVSGANGTLVAINGSGNIISSTDGGQHWSQCSGVTVSPNDLVYDGTNFIAAGNGIMTSSDGINWIARAEDTVNWSSYTVSALTTNPTSKGLITVACGSHGLILVSAPGDYGTWQKLYIENPNISDVYFGHRFSYVPAHKSGEYNIPEEFIGFGGGSIYKVTPMTGESTFRSVSSISNTTIQWFDKVWYENEAGMFYATTSLGNTRLVELRASRNLSEWNLIGTYSILNGSASNGTGIYVKVGNAGTILTSADGTNWTIQNITSANINDVVFAGGIFVAVGDNGTILTSTDGSVWHVCRSGTTSSLSSVAYDNGTYFVSGNGIILQSGVGAANPLTINSGNLPGGTIGVSYSSTLNASGGVAPYSWSASGLPEGLIINTATGEMYGTPTRATIADIRVTVTDSTGASSSKNLQFIISEAPAGSNPPTWPNGSTLTASGTTKTRTTLKWTAAADDSGVTGYRIYKDNSCIQTVTGTVYSCDVTGLSPSIAYTFRVQAGDADNNWTYGPTVTVYTDSSGGGVSSSTPIPATEPKPAAQVLDSNGNISKTITIKLDNSTGTAAVEVDAASLTNAFDKSKADNKGSKAVEVNIPKIGGVKACELILPSSFLTSGDAAKTVEIKTDLASLKVPGNMLPKANTAGVQAVSLTIATADKSILNTALQAQIGGRPVIELNLKLDGRQFSWSNESAPVGVCIPYTPTAEELKDPEHIVIWYIDGSGKAVSVPNGHFDPVTGTVAFSTTHFSYYAVSYNKVSFKDVSPSAWYSNAVGFIAARGITTGTGNGDYSPSAKLTRGEFIVMLMRAYGIAPDADTENNFTDAGSTYYTGYLSAAKSLGISGGVGDNMFAPGKEITRQEMFTLLYNVLKVTGRLPEGTAGEPLSDFSDAGQIASWAKDAITLLAGTGIIGGNGGKLLPTSTTTRAEMAQVLYNLLNK